MLEHSSYAGLCVGGPRDGQRLIHDRQYLTLAVVSPSSPPLLRGPEDVPVGGEISHVTYVHREYYGVGFWLPDDMDPPSLIRALAAGYWGRVR